MPAKIYYLDDEPLLTENFIDLFSSDSLEITTFTDVESFLKAAAIHPADLYFLDFRLPRTTGDRVAEHLPPETPKALISGDIQILTDFKFEAIFEKPLDVKKIQEFIDRTLD